MRNLTAILFFLFIISGKLSAQSDLLNMLNEDKPKEVTYATATFKSTRIMNGHSVEKMPDGQLDFRISHRFGTVNSGAYNFFGLDQSNVHFSLEYGVFNWVMVGIGRGTYEKTFDGFTKFTILRQSTGARTMPFSVSFFSGVALKTLKSDNTGVTEYFSSRLSYSSQLLIARKFNQSISIQITPTYVHRNLVTTVLDPNDLWAIGAGGRIKLSRRISLNGEYFYVIKPTPDYMSQTVYNPLSLGFDIETGGHVFQLFFTNSLAMIEKGFIGETTGRWLKGDIHFGFNISRVFTLKNNF